MGGFEHLGRYVEELAGALTAPEAQLVYLALLGGVFLISGSGKLRHPWLAAMAIVDFGAVRQPREWMGRALGAGECALGAALLAAPLAGGVAMVAAAAAAAALLAAFSVAIARALAAGRSFECRCFGDGATLSRATLGRTAALALLAAFSAVATDAGGAAHHAEEWVLGTVAGLAAIGTVGAHGVIKSMWRLPEPPAGLAAGTDEGGLA